jgi:hypothetical protein
MHTSARAPSRTALRRGADRARAVAGALLVGAGLAGCRGGPAEAPAAASAAPAARLAGTWRWVSALDVRTQAVHTPASAGFGATLEFRPDAPRAGAFTYARAGRPPVTGRFSLGSEDAPGNDFIVVEPGIDFVARAAWVAAGRDSLRLGGVMELGYNSTYARVAP